MMSWLQRNAALVVVFVIAIGMGASWWAGKLHVRWGDAGAWTARGSHDHAAHESAGQSLVTGDKVALDPSIVETAGITTVAATKGSVAANLRVTGEVRFAEGRVAHVTPRVPGAIREVAKTLGDDVSAGTPLCTIESVELGEARAKFVAALSERKLAERNYGRWKELFEKGLKTQNEFWAAENSLTRAKLDSEAAMGKLKALGVTEDEIAELEGGTAQNLTNLYQVKSLIKGTVLERHATLGENVEPKDQIFLVADLSELWVQAAVYVKDLSQLRTGMSGIVRIQDSPEAVFRGSVRYVGQRVDEKTRAAPLWIAIKNESAQASEDKYMLRPGMFVTVDVELSRRDDVLVIPLAAVQSAAGDTIAFVRVNQQGTPGDSSSAGAPRLVFERRKIELGAQDAEVAEITKGLLAGDQVVVKNAYLLKSEFEKSRISDGHTD